MEQNKILSADVLDIIFEGRNKEYGAYDLRKTYERRLMIAVGATIAICLIIFLVTILSSFVAPKKQTQILVQDVQLANVKEERKPEPPPPPPSAIDNPFFWSTGQNPFANHFCQFGIQGDEWVCAERHGSTFTTHELCTNFVPQKTAIEVSRQDALLSCTTRGRIGGRGVHQRVIRRTYFEY